MEADMTTLGKTKLTDTQLIALSGATQRQDGVVSLPDRIKGMAAQKLATSLMDKGFVREIRAKPGMPAWRRDEDGRTYALVITKLGRAAIGVADEGRTSMDAVKDVGLPGPRTHKGKRPVASAPDSLDTLVARAPDQGPARERDAARAQSSDFVSQGSQWTGQSVNSPRRGTKLAEVLALLEREAGASIEELTSATGWLPHTTRAALTGLRKRGYTVLRERKAEGGSVYRITGMAQARAA
jgi:Protein of unknown function (DUF3489)